MSQPSYDFVHDVLILQSTILETSLDGERRRLQTKTTKRIGASSRTDVLNRVDFVLQPRLIAVSRQSKFLRERTVNGSQQGFSLNAGRQTEVVAINRPLFQAENIRPLPTASMMTIQSSNSGDTSIESNLIRPMFPFDIVWLTGDPGESCIDVCTAYSDDGESLECDGSSMINHGATFVFERIHEDTGLFDECRIFVTPSPYPRLKVCTAGASSFIFAEDESTCNSEETKIVDIVNTSYEINSFCPCVAS